MSSGTDQHNVRPVRAKVARSAAILPDAERLCDFLKRKHPQSTAHHVEAETGVPAGTVEKWISGKSRPGFLHFGALISVYGAELLASAYERPPRWLDREAKLAHEAALDREIDELQRRRAEAARLREEACGD